MKFEHYRSGGCLGEGDINTLLKSSTYSRVEGPRYIGGT